MGRRDRGGQRGGDHRVGRAARRRTAGGRAAAGAAASSDRGGLVPQRVATGASPSSVSFADAELALAPWTTALLVGDAASGPLVVIDRGGAEFEVAPRGPRPPLVVTAGAVRVTVVGTRFTVTREDDAATVAVAHGAVDVLYRGATARVGAGERWRPPDASVGAAPAAAPGPARGAAAADDRATAVAT
jgi:ferric-dicitrate binding protein FerR (iron transport regulator)